ncbi:kinase-like protein [Pluteus cervinus]|uniref:Kinase-like protein n=1 Tax=Pluteus cervinus TaxID=181527 RepID=A0ACD3AKY3_9AGAR|nr:kinase-like protein [Pluteus cervinus]
MDEDPADASEANALNLVFTETTIPVPRVRRVIERQWNHLIVMDYIPGSTLAEVWSTYSIWKKLGVAFTLRRHIRQLQRLKASRTTPPGPLSIQGPRQCENPGIFSQVRSRRGPFASYAELSMWFNGRCQLAMNHHKVPEDHPHRKTRFDDSAPLVFAHQDLNPRNIIVGEDGRLWIVDWAWAGYYPVWFEYVAMLSQGEHESSIGNVYKYWDHLIPFICGPYFEQERWMSMIAMGLYYR